MTTLPPRSELLAEALRLRARLAARTAPEAAPAKAPLPSLSVMFFAAENGQGDPYALVLEAAKRADAAGFEAVWLPERHFDRFGGPYPNPAVLAAAVAQVTTRIRIRAGSVILPLHDPLEIAESWAMVDLLSKGRIDMAFGSGWNPSDFALSPDTFADAKGVMRARLDELRHLWAGGAAQRRVGNGETIEVTPHPTPSQKHLNVWIASTGSAETFAWAGRSGFNVLTMVLGGSMNDVADRLRVYRDARRQAGLDPAAGRVTLMMHTYCDPDPVRTLARVKGPMTSYVRGALDVHVGAGAGAGGTDGAQRDRMADFAFQRYLRTASLIGTPAECRETMQRVGAMGVTEIACLLDFGMPTEQVLEGLDRLASLLPPRAIRDERRQAAIVGMACRFPGAPDVESFRILLQSGASALRPPPAGRFGLAPNLALGGFIDDIESFDTEPFRLAPAEAALMDPHQRLFLETVWQALEDAGLDPQALRGRDVGVFAAMYSTSYLERRGDIGNDPLAVPGGLASMVANRTSFVFDFRGPSETINTACSSGLVAVQRALQALRHGECEIAVVGGVSLLLSDTESASLARLGILAPDGRCRAFGADAAGQARGEGVGVVILKRLDRAIADGDAMHASIAGAAVRHAGGSAGSLTLPSTVSQSAAIVAAWHDAGLTPEGAGYIEAHGAGTKHGDLSEFSAMGSAFGALAAGNGPLDWRVGSVKPSIGSLDAAGGIAGLIAAVLAVDGGFRPGVTGLRAVSPELALQGSGLTLGAEPESWPAGQTRRAGVHAYGLGGVTAHVLIEQVESDPQPERPRRAFVRRHYPVDAEQSHLGNSRSFSSSPGLSRGPGHPPVPRLVPGTSPGMTSFDRGPQTDDPNAKAVPTFYDHVARAGGDRDGPLYLTLAPFPEVVPGFSWTRVMQNPAAHPAHWRMMVKAQREMRDVIFEGVDFPNIHRVLDFGCGFATDLMDLAGRYQHLECVGYTISPEQAAAARQRVAAAGLSEQIEIHCRDSAADPFPGRFQLAFGFEVGHHIADKDGLFANLAAHLDDGATLALIDCAADTAAPIALPEVGSWTSTLTEYADILTRHGFRIEGCIDASQEVANFLFDPGLEQMLEDERGHDAAALVERVQRSWDGFGQALREGLLRYLLIVTERRPGSAGLEAVNRERMRP